MKFKYLLLTAIASLFLSPPLFANGLSVGLIYGQSSDEFTAESCENDRRYFTDISDGQLFTCTVDDTDSAIGINLSYHLTDMWGVELGYIDLGQTSSFLTGPGTGVFRTSGENVSNPETIDSTAAYLAGTITFDLAQNVSMTGRLGASQVEYDLVSTLFEIEINDDDTATMAGVSLNYQFTNNWSAQLRYDYFDIDLAIDVVSAGISYKF